MSTPTTPSVTSTEFNNFHDHFHKNAEVDQRTGFKRCNSLRYGQAFINKFWKEGDERNSILYNEEDPSKAQEMITSKYVDWFN